MSLHQAAGFGLALLSMVLYGLYMGPRKTSGASHGAFTLWMAVGILGGTCLIGIIDGGVPRVSLAQYLVIAGSGVIWGTGSSAYSRAVQVIGLSRSTPVKNLSAMFGALLGLIVFREFTLASPLSFVLVLGGSAAIVASAGLLGSVQAPAQCSMPLPAKRLALGILCSFWAAVAYSLYTVPMKIAYQQGVTPSEFLLCMGHGCFIGMVLPLLLSRRSGKPVSWHDRRLAILAGLMWALGSLCANVAVRIIGVAVTWPLTKTTLVAALYGAFVLREVDLTRHRGRFTAGVVLSVAGVVALAAALARS